MRAPTLALLLILCSFPAHPRYRTTPAPAETYRHIYSGTETHTTGTSGFKSSRRNVLEPGSNAFLQGLEFDEKGDKPCFIRAHWWRHTADNLGEDFTTFFDVCKSDAKGDQRLVFSYSDTLRQAVNSVRVCSNNDNNHRMKGVELTSAYIDRNNSGKVENSGKKLVFDRPNCASWKATQSCPAGMAAVGLNIEHSGEEITGLGLKCTKPVVKSVTPHEGSPVSANERLSKMEKDILVTVDKDGRSQKMSINDAVARHEVNGATVVVIDGGKISTVRHYGVRSRKSNLPTNKDTIYQAASTSKFFAAVGMLVAADKDHGPKLGRSAQMTGNANDNSLIDRWVDKQFKGDRSDYPKDITVARLLSHTAGLDTHGIGTARRDSKTDMENILLGSGLNPGVKPKGRPGTFYDYSGGGFVAAEAMLEIHSGRTATDFLNKEVLRAFGLTKSTFSTASDNMTNLARGCSRGICNDSPEYTTVKFAGGLLANPEEFARMLLIIMNDGKDEGGTQVLPLDRVRQLMTPAAHIDSTGKSCTSHSGCPSGEKCYGGACILPINADGEWYGLGVSLSDAYEFEGYPKNLEHGGAQDNAAAYFFIDRRDRNGIVIMVNGEYDWKKNGVEYGADPLVDDIRSSFSRNYP
jgi:CubicO group peptidase (beta-lactamase class C family)